MATTKIKLTGKRFGRLIVIGESEKRSKNRDVFWWCQCDCGELLCIAGKRLRNKNTKSCGCYKKDTDGKNNHKHGQAQTPTYRSWLSMIKRCRDPKNASFKNYGAKGISACKRWHNFESFLKDMGFRPNGFSLDRIDSSKNYEPNNCRWASKEIQYFNKKSKGCHWDKIRKKWVARIMYNGQRKPLGCFDSEKEAIDAYKKARADIERRLFA